jgi:hypothetical protein
MNIPIRMIGVVTTIFWIFLIIFSISAAYSAKDLQFEWNENPQMNVTSDHKLLVSLPINISNKGYYSLGSFYVTTEISNSSGFLLAQGVTPSLTIPKGERVTVFHNVTIDLNDLLQNGQSYLLFNDTKLNIAEHVGMKVAEVIPVQASGNFSFPWGAPLYNFRLGQPEFAAVNLTHFRISVPISFENHALFDVVGDLQIRMYDGSNVLVGSSQTAIEALQHSAYSGNFELYVTIPLATFPPTIPSGHFEVTFTTPLFSYGPWVIPYG